MKPATRPIELGTEHRLLVMDTTEQAYQERTLGALVELLSPGDVLVLNDAGTLPGSLFATTSHGDVIELRLDGRVDALLGHGALVFGAGDWRTTTERRTLPALLRVGDALELQGGLRATVTAVDASLRWVFVRFSLEGSALWQALFRAGRPVQYSYLERELSPWDVQTVYAGRLWAAEMPSAGKPLTAGLLLDLRRRGVEIATLTHAAGLSSTGSAALDTELPGPERYEISELMALRVERARARGGRVIAVGTSVVRALESCVRAHGKVKAVSEVTTLRVGAQTKLHVVQGLLTGMHEPGTSHFSLLEAFGAREFLLRAHAWAAEREFRGHEFGDSALLLPEVLSTRVQRASSFGG